MEKSIDSLNFVPIQKDLDILLTAFGTKLEREIPQRCKENPVSRIILASLVKVTENTYHSIQFLCAEKPECFARKLEYIVAVPPMVRTLLDALCNIIFMFEDLPNRIDWFAKSGWRENYEKLNRYKKNFGNDIHWKKPLSNLSNWLDETKNKYEIDIVKINEIPYWPIPFQMTKGEKLSKDRLNIIKYLIDYFHRELSSESHLSFHGLIKSAAWISEKRDEDYEDKIKDLRTDNIINATTFVLALLSELENELKYERTQKLIELWVILNETGISRKIYELRYRKLLMGSASPK